MSTGVLTSAAYGKFGLDLLESQRREAGVGVGAIGAEDNAENLSLWIDQRSAGVSGPDLTLRMV